MIRGGTSMSQRFAVRSIIVVTFALYLLASAVAQMPNPYGPPISLENAKKAAAPALAEAAKNNWNVAIDKARSAALFKRPTKAFQDALAAGGDSVRLLRIQGVVPVEGGIPLVADGKIVGAIGVSGVTSAQDNQCAKAGADTVK